MPSPYSRRHFLKQTAFAAGTLPLLTAELPTLNNPKDVSPLKIHIFSKHLQFLTYAETADAAAEMGFNGVDWSVRPNGHIIPERVETDLPKAVEALRSAGFAPLMMTTAVGEATNATDQRVLRTAAKLGFRYYRMNWYQYAANQSLPESLGAYEQKLAGLSELNKTLNLVGCYQNHAGELVGASVWELWQMLKGVNQQHMGVQYDIRHATVEGGLSWKNGLRLLEPHIKTIVLKDFRWAQKNGRWTVENTPIGQGMVDFTSYFRLLKKYELQVPVCLHTEYPLGGAENGATKLSVDKRVVFEAMKQDLRRVNELWQAA